MSNLDPLANVDLDRTFLRFRDAGDPDALATVFDATAGELLRVARHLVPLLFTPGMARVPVSVDGSAFTEAVQVHLAAGTPNALELRLPR